MDKQKLVNEVYKTLEEMDNEDENLDKLESAMVYFCSSYDKCEGYKTAITLTLDDQINNHFGELEEEDLQALLKLLNK